MKYNLSKAMHYMWYYFWNIGINFLVLLPILTVLLFLGGLMRMIKDISYELKCDIADQIWRNSKKLSALKERFKNEG